MRAWRCWLSWLVGLALVLVSLAPAYGQDDADAKYKQHMTNGVKLFQDKNYDAAIAEFSAAYKAKPKASPLVNIALSHKALFRYPKAITVLEDALAKHTDTLDANDKKAAEEAVRDLKALLAYVTVKLVPATATLAVDGEDQPKGGATRNVPLGPGPHTLEARSDGYAPRSEKVTVASGERDRVVELKLTPDKGYVTFRAKDAATVIAVDQKAVGRGSVSVFLAPGRHVVQMYTSDQRELYQAPFDVAVGQAQTIEEGASLPSGPMMMLPPDQRQPPKEPPPPPKEGFYGLGIGVVNTSLSSFDASGAGWSIGLRGGWRPTTIVGLELSLAYARTPTQPQVQIQGSATSSGLTEIDAFDGALESVRAGGNVRLMTRGEVARFVATFGGGVSHNVVSFDDACPDCPETSGTSGYGLIETGFEIDISGIFFGLTLQNLLAGLGTSTSTQNASIIDFGDFQGQVGIGLVGGYGTW